MKYDVIVIGAGPAGVTASIYANRFGLKTLILAKDFGMVAETAEVENYPGIFPIKGIELSQRFVDHAKKLGVEVKFEEVKSISKNGEFLVKTSSAEYSSKTLIYTLGGSRKKLEVPGEDELKGKGVSYCTTCDAAFYKDKIAAVVGGANSAVEGALVLASFAKKVYIIYRRDKLRALPSLTEKALNNEKIEVIYNATIKQINGKDKVESVTLNTPDGEKELSLDGIFAEIGSIPNVGIAESLGIELSEDNRIKVSETQSTNIDGFFAAGDVTDGSNRFDQIITAASEGAIAANSANEFINKN